MKRFSHHSGSALLIVLGMLSFMIISAVGFAVYMRSSRQPSSYLRRASMTRQMAKAALARAMDAVDRAINNNPHPGVGTTKPSASVATAENTWVHHIFSGTNSLDTSGDGTSHASPLCLEALAYIPPPLVNEARYYGRYVPSTAWSRLDFDMGRYTWLAIDVSDYLDINRLSADLPRKSAGAMRISLAHLFENSSHTSAGDGKSWDTFINKYRGNIDEESMTFKTIGEKEPLLSMADFALALGNNGDIGNLWSPFYTYAKGESKGGFYGTESTEDEETLRQMTFLTDSLMAPVSAETSEGEPVRDLSDGQYQPFKDGWLDRDDGSTHLGNFIQSVGSTMNEYADWTPRLSLVGCATLCDYLDLDRYPVSLSIPTVERVPMICAIQPSMAAAKFAIKKTLTPADDVKVESTTDETKRRVSKTVSYCIDGSKLGFTTDMILTSLVYPFSHIREDDSDYSFKVDGRLSLFFSTSEKMPLRTNNTDDSIHLEGKNLTTEIADNSVIHIKSAEGQFTLPSSVSSESDAVKTLTTLRLTDGSTLLSKLSSEDNALLTVTYTWDQEKAEDEGGDAWSPAWSAAIWEKPEEYVTAAKCNLKPLKRADSDGGKSYEVDSSFEDSGVLSMVQGGYDNGVQVWLQAAALVRVLTDNRVVDMVPACLIDDQTQNDVTLGQATLAAQISDKVGGTKYPVLRFDTGVNFKISLENLNRIADESAEIDFAMDPTSAMVADPRWNHAPEHWFQSEKNLTEASAWLDTVRNNCLGQDGRDGDIFMATSDAGYMQSIYELAFLTRLTDDLPETATTYNGIYGDMTAINTVSLDEIPSSFGETINRDRAWLTYDPMGDNEDDFDRIPRANLDSGFRVNPYTDSTNVLMAVFANTPIDWNRASTNFVEGAEFDTGEKASDFNKDSAFNQYSSDTKIAWEDLEAIAQKFIENRGTDWENAWQDLDWSYDADRFCGVDLSGDTGNLWTADRKFLYGFWRECFAARQQMFLIFVRAEPTMMGGEGDVPPQLGSRAVALVWRDPRTAEDADTPHQMRILMYRQFD